MAAYEPEERSSISKVPVRALDLTALHAQGGVLQLIIMAEGVVFVGKQRRDAYYRNDPSKYGLKESGPPKSTTFIKIVFECGILTSQLNFMLLATKAKQTKS